MNIMNDPQHKPFLVVIGATLAVVLMACAALYSYRAMFHTQASPFSAMTPASSSSAPAALTTFRDDEAGYALSLPDGWRVEQDATSGIAAYPSPDAPECRVSLSVFPFVAEEDRAAWIAATIGADPTLAVRESSSEDVPVGGAPAVRWAGTIDGSPATLVYAFASAHAYEIAPSSMNGDASSCDDVLDTFLEGMIFTSSSAQ